MQNAELVLSRLTPSQRHQDITGQKFHKLTALSCAGKRNGGAYWHCSCECGGSFITAAYNLKRGLSKSCGCIKAAVAYANSPRKHCYSRSEDIEKRRLHNVWVGMRRRCQSPSRKEYASYGGAGISVCPEWEEFECFLKDMGPRPTPKHSLDRWPNKSGNYEMGNCRWSLMLEQQNNRKNNLMVSIAGSIMTIAQMCRVLGGCRHAGATAYHDAENSGIAEFDWLGTMITIPPKS